MRNKITSTSNNSIEYINEKRQCRGLENQLENVFH